MLKRPVFREAENEAQFQKNGFIILPLISQFEAEQLLHFYLSNPHKDAKNFHATHYSNDSNYKQEVHNKIKDAFENRLNKILNDYIFLIGGFVVKESGSGSVLQLHSDGRFVDEEKYQSLGIWCPLVDTNEKNGWLGVVPFSHEIKDNIRGNRVPSPISHLNDYITKKYGKFLKVKAGEAVLFDHRLLHFSSANLSNEKRVALNMAVVPKNVSIIQYAVFNNSTEIQQYEVPGTDFFFEYDNNHGPDKKYLINSFELKVVPYTKGYLRGILDKRSLQEKIKTFFLG